MAVCDRCSTKVETGDEYAVYSEAQLIPNQDVGTMLFCEGCVNELYTEKIWAQAKPLAIELDPSMDFNAIKRAQKQVNDFAIAMLAKRRGLSVAQARQEAREIAKLWWKDQQAAEQQLRDQLSAPIVDTNLVTEDDTDESNASPLMEIAGYLIMLLMVAFVVGLVVLCVWLVS
jgi:hypothetical protein